MVFLTAGIPSERRSAGVQSSPRHIADRLVFLGEFSNMRFTTEHAYGVSVELWREGASVFGLLDFADGLQGDMPTGLLQDVAFKPATGQLSFNVKLTSGLHYCPQHPSGVPSRDVFLFTGNLTDFRLRGKLTRSDTLHPDRKLPIEELVLKKRATADPIAAANYVEWKRKVEPILKFRGPKW
jgi:hypothetical protein